MIAVDTSALMAVLLDEPEAEQCMRALHAEAHLLISAGTLAEAWIVAHGHGATGNLASMLEALAIDVRTVTAESARRVAEAHWKWGKGRHPAGLNFGDCFAYEAAKTNQCALLFTGRDFARTDLQSALIPID